jgi:hypothetical protein
VSEGGRSEKGKKRRRREEKREPKTIKAESSLLESDLSHLTL